MVEQCGLRKCKEILLARCGNVVAWGIVRKFSYQLWGKMSRQPLSKLTKGTVEEYSLGNTEKFGVDRLAICLRGWWLNVQ
jgi:hypothetical protein